MKIKLAIKVTHNKVEDREVKYSEMLMEKGLFKEMP